MELYTKRQRILTFNEAKLTVKLCSNWANKTPRLLRDKIQNDMYLWPQTTMCRRVQLMERWYFEREVFFLQAYDEMRLNYFFV